MFAHNLSDKRSDKLQVIKLNRSKIIIELMDFLHGKRKGGEGGMSPKRINISDLLSERLWANKLSSEQSVE